MACEYARKMCAPSLLTFDKNGGSQLLEGLDFARFTLNKSEFLWNGLQAAHIINKDPERGHSGHLYNI